MRFTFDLYFYNLLCFYVLIHDTKENPWIKTRKTIIFISFSITHVSVTWIPSFLITSSRIFPSWSPTCYIIPICTLCVYAHTHIIGQELQEGIHGFLLSEIVLPWLLLYIKFHFIYVPIFIIHLPVKGQLGWIQFLAIVNIETCYSEKSNTHGGGEECVKIPKYFRQETPMHYILFYNSQTTVYFDLS